ncbi:MAG: hypothetical protein K2Y21_02885 [Phycisphaerales bacterium]|nr:hypothetical protein [Phycisphaerales bacterium]
MSIDWDSVSRVAIPFGTLVAGAAINRMIERRPKLLAYFGHISAHSVQPVQPDTDTIFVHTHSIVLRNAGRLAAKNIRIRYNAKPMHIDIFPQIAHSYEKMTDGSEDLCIPTLPPSFEISISHLYYNPLTWNQIHGSILSDDGPAKVLRTVHATPWPAWRTGLCGAFFLIGCITSLYVVVQTVKQFL